MAQPSMQKLGVPEPDQTVNVTGGNPEPNPATIPSGGVVQFNADGNDYLIQLWDKENKKHPAICVFLPANGSITLAADPEQNDANATVPYNVLSYSGAAGGGVAANGGGKSIIIGSGNE